MAKKTGKDVYTIVTEQILSELEKGIVPWNRPWAGNSVPISMTTGKPYRGINILLLNIAAAAGGYKSNYWITQKAAKARGASLKPSQYGKYSTVVFWNWVEKEDKDTGEIDKFPILMFYQAYNVEQFNDLGYPKPEAQIDFDPIVEAESIVAGYQDRPEIKFGGDEAYYSPISDKIQLPHAEMFNSPESYYSTLYHEMGHSTGHESRLNREVKNKFANELYSKEELVAELTSAFLCGVAGINKTETLQQSVAYLDHWITVLKEDRRIIVQAAGKAQKAADFILGNRGDEEEEDQALTVSA